MYKHIFGLCTYIYTHLHIHSVAVLGIFKWEGSAPILEVVFYPERKRGYKGVWGHCPQRGSGAEPLVGVRGLSPRKFELF